MVCVPLVGWLIGLFVTAFQGNAFDWYDNVFKLLHLLLDTFYLKCIFSLKLLVYLFFVSNCSDISPIVQTSSFWKCFNFILISSFFLCFSTLCSFSVLYCVSYSYVKISTLHGHGSSRKTDTKICLWSARQQFLKWVRRIAPPFKLANLKNAGFARSCDKYCS